MKNLLKRLQEPFPDRKNLGQSLLNLVGVGIFVGLFLYIIRPFGLQRATSNIEWFCVGFGMVTIIFGFIYELITRYVFRLSTDVPSWTLGKWIIYSMILILWITVGNSIYISFIIGWSNMSISFVSQMLFNTFLVGIFPIVFSGLTIQLNAARNYQRRAEQFHPPVVSETLEPDTVVYLSSDSTKGLKIPVASIRYLEAQQNYVSVVYLQNGKLQKDLLRGTVSSFKEQLKDTSIIRCHRSYLVNIDQITLVSGNAQGLKLQLKDVEAFEVPVSRSYIPTLREILS